MSNHSGGVLLLSHVGFSFLEDLITALRARGLRAFVLTSLPLPEHRPQRVEQLKDQADRVRATAGHVLTHEDVEGYLSDLRADGEWVLATLTVWEGYRHLMAAANTALGVADLSEKQVVELRDKLSLRNRLAGTGLSRVRAAALTPQSLREHQLRDGRFFIKPVSGIASYGTFPLTAATTWDHIEKIVDGARSDTVYASAFGDGISFLVEDYLPGPEFSFEVILVDSAAHVVAIHEKCEVTETAGAVLENAVTSPPTGVSERELAEGIRWVTAVLTELALEQGCFHIEARHGAAGWDLIEVNPRVGGSLISPSVKALNGEADLLDLWLDTLLRRGGFRARLQRLSFTADGATAAPNATFFRVFFAEPGRIGRIELDERLPLAPAITQIILKAGDVIEATAREVFLGQLLWRFPVADQQHRLPELVQASQTAVRVHYETAEEHTD